ncbi:MAG: type II toxin-antitoxin system Phd/YefM family antitoxin [Desulfatitalea sp.]
MPERIMAGLTASITELKKNPQALINSAQGEPIALLNHNKTTAYLIPAETYERLMEMAEDIELGFLIEQRKGEKTKAVEVGLDEL